MMVRRWAVWLVLLGVLVLSAFRALPAMQGRFSVQITGAVQRDFAGGEIYFESTPVGRQIYLQKAGPGEDLIVLTIILPPNERPGEYELSTFGSPTASYFEVVGGTARQFTDNIQGTLTIVETGRQFTGQVNFTAQDGDQAITVTGTFDQIPFGNQPTPAGAPVDPAASARNVIAISLAFLFFLLLIVNFIFQYLIGARVYPDNALWRWINGTRTFLLGWQDVRLYPLMILWSLLIAVMVVVIVLVLVML